MVRILLRIIFKYFPWILALTLLSWVLITGKIPFYPEYERRSYTVNHDLVLEKLEALGKLELVKYHFKEITEVKATSQWKTFFRSYSPDMTAALITSGEAVGCVDLTMLKNEDILINGDSLQIYLPDPELCYYKIDLEKSRIYDLETGYLSTEEEERKFIEQVYKRAENQIKAAAYESGIQEQTKVNATIVLKPLLEEITGKQVRISFRLSDGKLIPKK